MRDLVVAGGGPVGLATALYAARAGLDVVVRERRAGVVDKACGEGLMPGAVAALTDLGVPLEGRPLLGIRYVDGRHRAEAPFRSGPGLGVRRTTLHAALRGAVCGAGVVVEEQPVSEVTDEGDHVLVDGTPARYLVAADGLHSPIRRMLALDRPAGSRRRYGLRTHVDLAPWTDFVEVHWSSRAEAYLTPVSERLVGVAVLSEDRRPLPELLAQFPQLARRLEGRQPGGVLGAGPLWQRTSRRVAGRVLLVGDAAGYVDALTGEGIALGLAQARAAVAAIADHDPARYEDDWRRISRPHDRLTGALLTASRVPVVRRHLVQAAARVPGVFGAGVNQLARPS
ncbi:MAG: NAD(P)/FAD-dependent oxidoreductase [Nocardioides sp.]